MIELCAYVRCITTGLVLVSVQLAFILFSFTKIDAEPSVKKMSPRTSYFIHYLNQEIDAIKVTKYFSNATPQVARYRPRSVDDTTSTFLETLRCPAHSLNPVSRGKLLESLTIIQKLK